LEHQKKTKMAMNRIFTLLVFFLSPFFIHAQNTSSTVKGVVFDTASKRGLAYATISIVNAKDSTLVTFTRADSTGKFRIGSLDKGKYLLSSSYVGFVPVWKPLNIEADGLQIDFGNVAMTDVLNSGDVTVMARRPPVTISGDTVEFNTENFKTQPNAVVEDMLKKMPGITVDPDGTVRMNGQKINRVLVNGKEFFTGDPKMATKNLDADAVDKVQVFDKKSDRAEFTGVDDGQSEKTLNLKLKKDRNNALFGKVSAAAGTNARWDGQTNINKFNNEKQLSFIGMANNTNRQGFSISDVLNFTGELSRGMRSGGGGITIRMGGDDNNGLPVAGPGGQAAQGVATTYAGGINYNDTWNKKTDFNLSGMGSNIDLLTERNTRRTYSFSGNEFIEDKAGNTARNSKQQRVNMMIDSKIDSFNSLKFTPSFTTQQVDSRSRTSYLQQNLDGVKRAEGLSDNATHSDAFNFGGTALYRKRFQKKGRTISSTVSLAYNDSKQDGTLTSLIRNYSGGVALPDSLVNQKNRREAITRGFGANIVYTEPIGKKSLLEISAFYNTNVGNAKRITNDYGAASGKYDQFNTRQSNDFKSDYSYTGNSLSFRSNQKKINYTIGTSFQEAKLNSYDNSKGTLISQTFSDVLPNASLTYKIASSRTVSVNYSTSTTQPSTTQLQPVEDVSDPTNSYKGNPNLKRSYAQSVSVNYFSTNMYTQRNFFAFLSMSKTDNAITNADVQTGNLRTSMPVNVNGNYLIFGSINAGFPLKKLKSRLDIGIGTNFIHNNSFVNGTPNAIDNMSISPNLTYNFFLDGKMDITANARLGISKAKYSAQPQINSNYLQQSYGFDMTNYLPWGLIVNNNLNYSINSGRADGFNTTVGYWNASIAKAFLKNKRAEIKLSAFDLLNQNQGISRSANQNYLEDTRYNVLQQYFQLGFTFRLNKAGSAANGPQVITRTIGG
jgi:hypothetical protein